MKYYAGIGSRSVSTDLCDLMTAVASKMESQGWILRSGGAAGSDSAFEKGVSNPKNKEIYFPCNSFMNRLASEPGVYDASKLDAWDKAMETIDEFHPNPKALSAFARKLMARNAMQVLGPDLNTPVKLVVAYTKDGLVSGGTGQALRIAKHHNIEIRNLGNKEHFKTICDWTFL